MLTVLGQWYGSSQKTLPTSGRTALETSDTSMARSQHSMPHGSRYSSDMNEKALGEPHEPTVSPGTVGEDVESGAEA